MTDRDWDWMMAVLAWALAAFNMGYLYGSRPRHKNKDKTMTLFDPSGPCMRCEKPHWEVVYDDGVMEYAVCKKCEEAMSREESLRELRMAVKHIRDAETSMWNAERRYKDALEKAQKAGEVPEDLILTEYVGR